MAFPGILMKGGMGDIYLLSFTHLIILLSMFYVRQQWIYHQFTAIEFEDKWTMGRNPNALHHGDAFISGSLISVQTGHYNLPCQASNLADSPRSKANSGRESIHRPQGRIEAFMHTSHFGIVRSWDWYDVMHNLCVWLSSNLCNLYRSPILSRLFYKTRNITRQDKLFTKLLRKDLRSADFGRLPKRRQTDRPKN